MSASEEFKGKRRHVNLVCADMSGGEKGLGPMLFGIMLVRGHRALERHSRPIQWASSSYQKLPYRESLETRGEVVHLWGHVGRVEGARPVLHAHLRMRVHRAPVAGPGW